MARMTVAIAGAASLFLLPGSHAAADESEKSDLRVGEKVDRICFGRNINNFKAIKGEDDAILLEKGVNDWYKASLTGACPFRELNWAQSVAIEQHPAGGCVTSGDYLIFSRSAFGEFRFPDTRRCAISEIHKWYDNAPAPEETSDAD